MFGRYIGQLIRSHSKKVAFLRGLLCPLRTQGVNPKKHLVRKLGTGAIWAGLASSGCALGALWRHGGRLWGEKWPSETAARHQVPLAH